MSNGLQAPLRGDSLPVPPLPPPPGCSVPFCPVVEGQPADMENGNSRQLMLLLSLPFSGPRHFPFPM